jgi:hypothetical protein
MAKLVIAAVVVAALFSGSLYTAYRAGYHDGATVGYQAGVMEHRLYAQGRSMASDWDSYVIEHNRQFWKR